MVICICVFLFFTTILTAPLGVEWREKRRLKRDRALAKVVYLPTKSLRK